MKIGRHKGLPMLTEQRDFREEIDERLREEELFKFIEKQLIEREFKCFIARVIDERSLEDIRKEHNVSRERIHQVVRKAIRKLSTPKSLAFYIKIGGPLGYAAEKRIKEYEEQRNKRELDLQREREKLHEEREKVRANQQEERKRKAEAMRIKYKATVDPNEDIPDFMQLHRYWNNEPFLAFDIWLKDLVPFLEAWEYKRWLEQAIQREQNAVNASAKSYS